MKRRDLLIIGAGAAACPLTVRAQQKAMPVIGVLSSGVAAFQGLAFRQGLGESGYVEGQNVVIEYRVAEGRYDRLPALAADLVGHKVDVIATIGMPSALAAKRATSTIPIVFNVGIDPVAEGLVASLARPGGNLTGITIMSSELIPKRLELLSELVPQAGVIALLVNPNNVSAEPQSRDMLEAARHAKRAQSPILKASTESEIADAFTLLVQQHTNALVVGTDVFFYDQREQLAALAAHYAIPVIYEGRDFATAGGLISYGPSLAGMNRQVGAFVGRVLAGAKPADLPVEQPSKFELVINLKTANALGLTVPQSMLQRADEVVE